MRVRTLQDHGNSYGDNWEKSAKDKTEYEIPDDREAKILIDAGLVEKTKS